MAKSVQIDVVIDITCPWAYIGKKHLEKALENAGDLDVSVRWRPFQANPDLPDGGVDYREHLLRHKDSLNALYEKRDVLCSIGSTLGIDFRFESISRAPNTLEGHQLLRYASRLGLEGEMLDILFHAYFTDGLDVGDRDILIMLARRLGMPSRQLVEAFDEGRDRSLILKETAAARAMGMASTPVFFFNRKHMLQGVSDPLQLLTIIEALSVERPQYKRNLAELFDVKALVSEAQL